MKKLFILIFSFVLVWSCTEEYPLKSKNFENILIVEATITNELKQQEILLSRTSPLDTLAQIFERNATVNITDSNNNTYNFAEGSQPGKYLSSSQFQAIPDVSYQLHIRTSNGEEYTSTQEIMPPVVNIDNINPVKVSANGVEGVQVVLSSLPVPDEAKYFRYTFEETYKIVAPFHNINDLIYSEENDEYSFVLEQENTRICYSSNSSTAIIQTSLDNLNVDRVDNFPIWFIPSNSSLILERYSIIVKQYVQSFNSYNFYSVLKELGTVENILLENQLGFIRGNIFETQNENIKVFGFFDVSPVSVSNRLYFNYSDFDFSRPPYFYPCIQQKYDINLSCDLDELPRDPDNPNQSIFDKCLLDRALTREIPEEYYSGREPIFILVSPACGNCTTFSSNTIPEFWEE